VYPSSTNVIGELQHYFTKFIIKSILNKSQIPSSTELCSDVYLNKNSFLRLLFDNKWEHNNITYNYLFREIEEKHCWPINIKDKAMIYPLSARYYVSDDNIKCNKNIFLLQKNDLTMLDALLYYRVHDSSSMIILDSTSNIDPIFKCSDSTALLIINYKKLNNFQKLIFLYLNLKINKDVSYYNNTKLVSNPNNVLELLYEAYILEIYFKYIADSGT